MKRRLAQTCLAVLGAACSAQNDSAARDTSVPDTAAIQGAGSAPHPTPAEADSAAARDSAVRARRP